MVEQGLSDVTPVMSRRMRSNRAKDTAPELALRRALHARGLRYRVHQRPELGVRANADLVFTGARVAVFVDGCFWHGCPEHYRPATSTRVSFWHDKIEANVQRDRRQTELLASAGWAVVRIWEHDDTSAAARRVEDIVRASGQAKRKTPTVRQVFCHG